MENAVLHGRSWTRFRLRTMMIVVTGVAIASGTYKWLSNPRVFVHAATIDIGEVDPGSKGEADFVVENVGWFPLQVDVDRVS